MSDAISTIQLGVATQEGLDHLLALKNAFAGLRSEMEQFNATKSSLDTLTGGAAASATAIDRLTAELEKSQSEVGKLKSLVQSLAESNKTLAASAEAASAAQIASTEGVTKATADAAAQRTRITTENLAKQVAETQAAEKAMGDAIEETSRKFRKSQAEKVGRTSFSVSEPSTEVEFNAAATLSAIERQKVIQEKRDIELYNDAVAQAAKMRSIQEQRDTEEFNERVAHAARLKAIQEKRDTEEYQSATAEAGRLRSIQEKRDTEEYQSAVAHEQRMRAIQEKRDTELFATRTADANRLRAIQEKRDTEEYSNAVAQEQRIKALQEKRDTELHQSAATEAERIRTIQQKRDTEEYNNAVAQAERMQALQEKRDIEMHNKRVKDFQDAETFAERQRQLNARYTIASPTSRLGTAKEAMAYGAQFADPAQGQAAVTARFGAQAALDANAAGVAKLETEVAKLTASTQRNSAATRSNAEAHREAAAAMTEAHAMVRGLAGGLNMLWTTWGSFAPLVAGAAITASLSEIYKVGKDVEYQLTFVKALSGEAVDFDKFLRVSESSLSSLKDAAGGMRALSQAGLNATQSLMALPTVLNLAAVGEMSVGQAALAMTGVVNAFNMSIGDMDRVGDIFAKVAATTNTSVAGMTESMKQASTVGAMFKVRIEEAAASIGILAQRNITGTAAGTSLTNALKGLYEPTDQAKEAMKRLGIEVKSQEDGTLKNYTKLLEELAVKLSGLNEQGQLNFLGTITDQRGAKTISAIIADLGGYKKALKEAEDATGFMSQAVSVLDDTVTGSARRMANAFEGSFTRAFVSAEPAIRGVLDRLADIGKSQQFVDMVDRLARGAVALTTFLLDHAKALGIVAAAYVGLRVISSATSALVAYQAASLSAARASIAAAAGATDLSVAATIAATGVGRLAAALRIASASAGWLSLIGTLLFTAYELFAGGADKATLAEEKHQNTLKTTIDFLDREIDRLKQRNQLLDENLFRDFGVGTGEPPEKKTVQTQLDKEKTHLTELETKRNQLQSDIADAERKLVTASGPQVAKQLTTLNALKATLKDVQAQVDETSTSIKKIDKDVQEIDKLTATGNQKNSQYNLLRKATDLQHQMGGGGVDFEKNGNAQTKSLLPGFEEFIARVKEGRGDIKTLQSEFDSWYRTVGKSLENFDKEDKKHENALMRAELAKLQGSQDRFSQLIKNQNTGDKQENRQGNLGDLQLENRELQRQMGLQLVILDVSKAKVEELKKHKDQEGAIQTEIEKQKKAVEQYSELQTASAEKTQTILAKYDEDNLRDEAQQYRDKGDYVSAYLKETQAKYETTLKKIKADLADPALKLTLSEEDRGVLVERQDNVEKSQGSGLLNAYYQQQKETYLGMLAEMQAKTAEVLSKGANEGDAASMLGAARMADEIRAKALPALREFQKALVDIAKASGNQKNITDATNIGKNLSKDADQLAKQWQLAGKAIAKSLEEAFGKGGKAAGGMIRAYIQYAEQQKVIDDQLAKNEADKTVGYDDYIKNKTALEEQSAQAQMNNYANMAGAASGFFDHNSRGYAALMAIEKTFRAFQIASQIASVATTLSTESTKQGAYGITALASALTAPYPLNIVAFATVAAMLAAIGVAIAGGGGSAAPRDIAKDRQSRAGTQAQGVAGDESATGFYEWELQKSESIDKSLSALKDNSNIALRHTSGMLAALQSIRDNIGGMAKAIATTAGLRGTYADMAGQGFGSNSGFLGFNKDSKTLMDTGLEIANGQSLQQIMQQGLSANKYQDIHEESSSFWGLFSSESDTTHRQDIDSGLKQDLVKVLSQMRDTVAQAATYIAPGSKSAVEQALDSFKVEIGKMSFKDMKPDEIKAALEATFSQVGDQMAQSVMPQIGAFNKAGEGYYETLVRVSTGVESARFELDKLGMTVGNLSDVANKQGDVAAELVRQQLVRTETTTRVLYNPKDDPLTILATRQFQTSLSGVGAILKDMQGSAADLVAAYKQLVDIRRSMASTGLNTDGLTSAAVAGAGGLDELHSGVNDYLSSFYTDAEQNAFKLDKLKAEFAALGQAVPTSKDDFKHLVGSIDLTSEGGQRLYGHLMTLAKAFADVTDAAGGTNAELVKLRGTITTQTYKEESVALVDLAKRWMDVRKNAKSLVDELDKAMGKTVDNAPRIAELWQELQASQAANALVTPEQQLEMASELKDLLVEKGTIEKENAQTLIDLGKQLRDYVQGLKVGDLSPMTNAQKLQEASSQYNTTLAAAQGGDQTALGDLQNKAQTFLELARTFYASSEQYKAIFGQVTGQLDAVGADANTKGQTQIEVANSQLSELQKLRDLVAGTETTATAQYNNAVSQLTTQLAMLQAMEATLGVTSTLPQIMRDLPAELAAKLTVGGIAAPAPTTAPAPAPTYTPVTAPMTTGGTGGLTSWFGVSFGHAKGLDFVPYDGYMATLHKGERVLTAAATSRMDAGQAELLAEVAALRAEVAALRNDQRQQTGDLIRSHYDASERAAEKVVDGHREAADNAAWKQSSAATLK